MVFGIFIRSVRRRGDDARLSAEAKLFRKPEVGGDSARIVTTAAAFAGVAADLIAHRIASAAGRALPVGVDAVARSRGGVHRFREQPADDVLGEGDLAEPRVGAGAAHFPAAACRVETHAGLKCLHHVLAELREQRREPAGGINRVGMTEEKRINEALDRGQDARAVALLENRGEKAGVGLEFLRERGGEPVL